MKLWFKCIGSEKVMQHDLKQCSTWKECCEEIKGIKWLPHELDGRNYLINIDSIEFICEQKENDSKTMATASVKKEKKDEPVQVS